jgi:PEGA domain
MMKIHVRDRETGQFLALWIALLAMLSIANGAEVVLTSDPPGAVISVTGKEAGVTPLTLDLPAGQPVEVTSRFGPLGPLMHTLTPDDNQVIAYQFKHEYGTIVVTCDRTDAALVIDGTGYGHPPAVVLVSPGRHKLFMTATNAPDKTREVELKAGERATVEMDFSGGSPETAKTSVGPKASPVDSPPPAPEASPSPKGRGPKPSPADRTRVVWEEPPPLIPAATEAVKPEPSTAPLPKRKPVAKEAKKISSHVALVSKSDNTGKRKAGSSPSIPATPDTASARTELQSRWQAKEEALKLEKAQLENQIKNSTGSDRERWKYRLAVWEEKMAAAKRQELVPEAVPR